MRLVAITTVKNEIDIIEAFVRHTTALVEHLVVLDNGSTDGTLDVLGALRAEGLPIDIVEDRSIGQYQWRRMTGLMHEHAVKRYQADWVVPLDADEFVVVPAGEPLIAEGTRTDRPLELLWKTYVPESSDDPRELNPVVRIRRRLVTERDRSKVLVPGTLARLASAKLSQGNHGLLIDGRVCPAATCEPARLAHVPIRSPGQFASKTAICFLQYRAMPDKGRKWGRRRGQRFELLKRDPARFAVDLRSAVLSCLFQEDDGRELETVEDPMAYLGGPLRYTPPVDERFVALRNVLAYAENLAAAYADVVGGEQKSRRARGDRPAAAHGKAAWHPIGRVVRRRLGWVKSAFGGK